MIPKLDQTALQDKVDTRDVELVDYGKYVNLYSVLWEDEIVYTVTSNSTFIDEYRSYSRFFATRRFQELNQE